MTVDYRSVAVGKGELVEPMRARWSPGVFLLGVILAVGLGLCGVELIW